jgi:phenylpyruvate tautomerase PptA (4-oxalocrotonate tautomerase family)
MPGINTKVVGFDKLQKKLDAANLTEPVKRQIIRDVTEEGQRFLAARVPRDTGALAGSMGATVKDEIGAGYGKVKIGGGGIFYAHMLEWGTINRGSIGLTDSRRRLTAAQRRSAARAGGQRIRPMRFMSKTIGKVRRELKARIADAVKDVEQRWAE